MTFGDQTVNPDKEADNSHFHQCLRINQCAKLVVENNCIKRYTSYKIRNNFVDFVGGRHC